MTKKKNKPLPPSKQLCNVLKFIIEKRKEDYMWRYHKYSESKPKPGYYWVTYRDGRVNDIIYENDSFGFSDSLVIAFTPFIKPKPYQPQEGGEG